MKKKKRIVLSLVLTMFITALGITGWRFAGHEHNQSVRIRNLENKISYLEKLYGSTDDAAAFVEQCRESKIREGYNYLAIGNSITLHPIADYWWAEDGMAASSPEKDYFHLTTDALEEKYGMVNSKAVTFYGWETMSHDRAETLTLIENYLNEDLDLVTIQLGENVNDLTDFESDFSFLADYIKERSGKAQILVIGDFWEYEGRDAVKQKIAEEKNLAFIDLSIIKDNEQYMCGLGASVYDDLGNEHIVEHEGTAKHPNDAGMEFISREIIKKVR